MSGDQVIDDAKKIFQEALDEILGDPLLSDLPHEVTIDEVKALLALEHGQAITVQVKRDDGDVYPIIVRQNATVFDLMRAIKRHVELKQQRSGGIRSISWKYVWKTYWLMFDGKKLKDRNSKLRDYGIQNQDEVLFVKRLKDT